MKYFNSVLFKSVCALSLIFLIQACDNEFSEIGTGIVGTPDFEIENKSYPVKTYNQRITPMRSNGLSENLLGYYYDPVFGGSKAHFVGQLTPKTFTPNFGDDTVLDSVVLTIPYASTATTSEDTTTYELDSLYGSNPIKLSVFRSNFYLRDFDPNADLDASQNYYSNGTLAQGEIMGTADLEGELIYEDPDFLFEAEPIELWETNEDGDDEVVSTLQPSLRLNLFGGEVEEGASAPTTLEFWEDLIISKEDDDVLSSSSSFYEYFRGLYFKAEPKNDPTQGSLIQLNFSSSNANVTLYYKYQETTTTDGEDTTTTAYGEYEMNFTGNRVTIFENNFDASITSIIEDTSTDSEGDDYLYLKGGEGAMAVVELFADEEGNSEADQLSEFREVNDGLVTVKRLINEAYLEFYVDEQLNTDLNLPNRVFLYDLDNNIPLRDFFLDQTTNAASTDSKYNHLVPLSTETTADGSEEKKYKIRLTEHLNNIIIRDSTNVKLGLVVSSNVGAASSRGFQNSIALGEDTDIEGIPLGTVLSPKSVVLHGSNSPVTAKRVKLNIYYTEPNN